MERHQSRSKNHIFFRNCLIMFLHVEKKMLLGNIAEEVKLKEATVKLILSKYGAGDKSELLFDEVRRLLALNHDLSDFVCEMADRKTRATDATKIKLSLKRKHGVDVSISKIRSCLRANGYHWRKSHSIQLYVNAKVNVEKRQRWAQ